MHFSHRLMFCSLLALPALSKSAYASPQEIEAIGIATEILGEAGPKKPVPAQDIDCANPPKDPPPVRTRDGRQCWSLTATSDAEGVSTLVILDPPPYIPGDRTHGKAEGGGACCSAQGVLEIGGKPFCPAGTSEPVLPDGSCCGSNMKPNDKFPQGGQGRCIPDPFKRPKPSEPDFDRCRARTADLWPLGGGRDPKLLNGANLALAGCCAGKVADRVGSKDPESQKLLCGSCCDQGTPYAFDSLFSGVSDGAAKYNIACTAECVVLTTAALISTPARTDTASSSE